MYVCILEGRGALVPTPPPIFIHDIGLVVGYVSSCLWTQHNLLRIVRSLTMFCSLCSYATGYVPPISDLGTRLSLYLNFNT